MTIEARKDRKCSLGFHILGIWYQQEKKRDNKGKQTVVSGTSKQKEQNKQDNMFDNEKTKNNFFVLKIRKHDVFKEYF